MQLFKACTATVLLLSLLKRDSQYSYKIKILSARKKKPITKQLYKLHDKFKSVEDMRRKVAEELKEEKLSGDILEHKHVATTCLLALARAFMILSLSWL